MTTASFAQQLTPTVIGSAGETLTGNNLLLDFSIGEIATETLTATGLSLTQGFIQGPDNNTGIEETLVNENDLILYPNPATDRLYLQYNDPDTHPVKVNIRDIQGRAVLSMEFCINPFMLRTENLVSGFYTVTVIFDNHQRINKKMIKQ